MRIPVGSIHSAHASAAIERSYTCAHCERDFVAHARGESRGEALSPLFAREQAAAKAAVENAEEHARSDAEENVRIAPCPHCGLRQPGVTWRYWGFWSFVTALPLMAIPFVGGFAWLVWGPWHGALAAAVLVSLAILAFRAAYGKWTQTARVVELRPVLTRADV